MAVIDIYGSKILFEMFQVKVAIHEEIIFYMNFEQMTFAFIELLLILGNASKEYKLLEASKPIKKMCRFTGDRFTEATLHI